MNKSIKFKFIFGISLLLVIAFTVMITLTTWQAYKKTENNVISEADRIVDDLNYSIQLYFNQYEKSIEQISTYEQIGDFGYNEISLNKQIKRNDKVIKEILSGYLNTYKETTATYFATSNKKIVSVPRLNLPANFDPTAQSWYKKAITVTDRVVWTEPYKDKNTNEYVITASKAIIKNGMVVGVLGTDIKLSEITNRVANMNIGYKGIPFIVNNEGKAIVFKDTHGEDVTTYPYIKKMIEDDKEKGVINYEDDQGSKLLVYNTNFMNKWKIGAVYSQEQIMTMAKDIQATLLFVGVITLIISITVLTYISIRITKPINVLKDAMGELSNGNLEVYAQVKSKDEIGDLANSFNTMVDRMKKMISVVNGSILKVRHSAENLSASAEETNASSEQMAVAVNEIAQGAAKSAEEAETASLNSTSLSIQINGIHEKSEEMTEIAQKASQMNQNGTNKMNEMKASFDTANQSLHTMSSVVKDLSEKITTIETVIQTITEISSQTNLLALNASIEAARAGDHGKGFAVVAEEVRKLAEQSVNATDLVKGTISKIQIGTNRVVEEMEKTKEIWIQQSQVVNETDQTFEEISHLMEDMQNSIVSVYTGIQDVSNHKDEVVTIIQNMAAMSEETAAACEQVGASTDEQLKAVQSVAHLAENLSELSHELQEAINHFKISNQ